MHKKEELDDLYSRKRELEEKIFSEWESYDNIQNYIWEMIKICENVGNVAADLMRYYLSESQSAYTSSEKGRAKELSLIGRDYEYQARKANAEKDFWYSRSKNIKASFCNSVSRLELNSIKDEIKKLREELDNK